MIEFQNILIWLLRQEDSTLSGKVVNLGDGGGLTRFGIAQNDHPGISEAFYSEAPALALSAAEGIYEREYWLPLQGNSFQDAALAASVFSCAVNAGVSRAVKLLQSCLGITEDGVLGPETLQHANAFNAVQLAAAFRAAWANFYQRIVAENPADGLYLSGWLARAARIFPNL
jgi:lysozyme family protein